jgi:hypothetical protein
MQASELIRRIGPVLYDGELWKKALAKSLQVDQRNVYRWIEGQFTPRPGVFADLLALLKTRRGELDELIAATEAYLTETEK